MAGQMIILRPVEGRLHVILPYAADNRKWIKSVIGNNARPTWDKENKRWRIARAHYAKLIQEGTRRYGKVRVQYKHRAVTICDESCQWANGDASGCECRCAGQYHGTRGQGQNWIAKGLTTLVLDEGVRRTSFVVESSRMDGGGWHHGRRAA